MRHSGMEFSAKSTAINTLANGRETCVMVMGNSITRMVASIRVRGSTMSSTGRGGKCGQVSPLFKESTEKAKKMVMESINGTMDLNSKVSG